MKHVSKCNICTNRLLNYKQYLQCSICTNHSHNKCNFLTKSEGDNILSHASSLADWICYTCKLNIFPFFGSSQDLNTHTNTNKKANKQTHTHTQTNKQTNNTTQHKHTHTTNQTHQ